MNNPANEFSASPDINQEAANWTARIDRGLSAHEQDEYTDWLAADPRRGEAMATLQSDWNELDRIVGLQASFHARVDPDLLEEGASVFGLRRTFSISRSVVAGLAAAAALAVAGISYWVGSTERSRDTIEMPAINLASRIEKVSLPDGSVVELNRGAVVEADYSLAERRVRLLEGEASFSVAKNPARPFVVEVGGIDVEAIGTVFNVKYGSAAVDVVVQEGFVRVHALPAARLEDQPARPVLEIRQRAVVSLGDQRLAQITTLTEEEFEEALIWQPRLLKFNAVPLRKLVAEFNRSNPVKIVIGDPLLEDMLLSSSFWSDDVKGFVRLMESSFGMSAEWRSGTEIALHRAKHTDL